MTTTTTAPPPVHHTRRTPPAASRRRLAQGPVRPLHPGRPAAGRHHHQGRGLLGRTNLTNLLLQMSIIGVVVLAELIVVLTGGIDISVGSALGLAAVLAAGLFGGPSVLLALVVALRHRRRRRRRQRLAGRLPRPRAVHRHPGHARPGPRPGLRLRQRHPDHPGGRVDLRRDRPDHPHRHPGAGHHLDRRWWR